MTDNDNTSSMIEIAHARYKELDELVSAKRADIDKFVMELEAIRAYLLKMGVRKDEMAGRTGKPKRGRKAKIKDVEPSSTEE